MGDAKTDTDVPIAVRTRSEAGDQEVDHAILWGVRHRKALLATVLLVCGGVGAGWTGLRQIEATAEERVLRRQASELQSKHVRANGKAVAALGKRMAKVEDDIADHADLTRTGIELLMASPSVAAALEQDAGLRARAAKAVSSGSE